MKKQIIMVLGFALFLAITSCKSQTEKPAAATNADTAAEAPTNIAKDITVGESKTMMESNNTNLVVLDIRTQEEIDQGMIEGARHLDFYGDDFKTKVAALDKNKEYLVYCRSGGRSAKAMKMMADAGFKQVYNMLGGYNEWSEHN